MNKSISLCYHPTTTVFVDDNQDFMRSIQLELRKTFPCKFYSDPLKALDFFRSGYQSHPFIQRCFIALTDEDLDHLKRSDHLFYNVDLRQIHKEIHVAERFKEVAVAVIDYTMPELNGLELSKKIRAAHPNIRILLLTGEADHNLAVEAFNEGIIDKFIRKDTPELITVLVQTIKELEHHYFIKLSQIILDKMNDSSTTLQCLSNPNIIKLFANICQKYHITEYYLIDSTGNFLLIDENNNPHWLALMSENELNKIYRIAQSEDLAPSMIEALKNKQKLVFLYTEDDHARHPSKWEAYLHTAQPIVGNESYYYALISNSKAYEWHPEKMVFYKDYLKQVA